MQRLLNRRRTIYWCTAFCCVIIGYWVIVFGATGWGTTSLIIGSGFMLVACLLGLLASRL